jgi:hypothetical protein
MRPDDDFIIDGECSPLFLSSPFPLAFLRSLLPDPGLGRLQGNLCLVPDFDPPLPEDAIQRAWNQAHAERVKKKEEGKKKKAEKARRKEEHDKRRKLQRQASEEEESSSIDDDYDEEEIHQYDWLDSMAEEGEQPSGRPS